MKHKIKIFLGIFSSSLIILGFFGLVAFNSALNASKEKEIKILNELSKYFIQDLVHDADGTNSKLTSQSIGEWLNKFDNTSFGFAIFTVEKNNMINVIKTKNIDKYFTIQIMKNNKNGLSNIDEETYTWTSRKIVNSPYFVSIIHQFDKKDADSFFKLLGIPLIITAAILLWVTTWVTIYLTSLYDKLNTQKNLMEFQVTHDPLTKLISRDVFVKRCVESFTDMKQRNSSLTLCSLNINNFKDINAALGRESADQLLVSVSKICKEIIGPSTCITRQGASEFSFIMENSTSEDGRLLSDKLLQSLDKNIMINNLSLNISTSIGIASFPTHADTPEELLRYAELSLKHAKNIGSRITIFHKDLVTSYKPNLDMVSLNISES